MVVERISGSTVSAKRRLERTAKPSVKTEDTGTPLELNTPTKQPLKLKSEAVEESAPVTTPKRKRIASQATDSSSRPETSRKRQKKAADADNATLQTPTPSSSRKRATPSKSKTPKKSGKTKDSPEKASEKSAEKEARRREKDVKYGNRCWLYQTELLDWHKYNFGISDLVALPATVKPNPKRPSTNTYCYRVYHLNWLKTQLDAGNGLNLPAGSEVNPENPQFVLENGPTMCREEAYHHYQGYQLNSDQLNRLKPCKKARPPDGRRAVEQWNVCDIEALLQQGENLKDHCPPAPPALRAIPVYVVYDDVGFNYYDDEVAEERECPCCVFFGLPG